MESNSNRFSSKKNIASIVWHAMSLIALAGIVFMVVYFFAEANEGDVFQLDWDFVGFGFLALLVTLVVTSLLILVLFLFILDDAYIQIDESGITGINPGSIGVGLTERKIKFEWRDIRKISFFLNRIIVHTDKDKTSFVTSYIPYKHQETISKIRGFGGENILPETSVERPHRRQKLSALIIVAAGIVAIFIVALLGRSNVYYGINDIAVVGDDVYAVGYACYGTSESDRPIVWKNGIGKTIGEIGNFNEAHFIANKGNDIYIAYEIDGQFHITRNNEEILATKDFVESFFIEQDTLFILCETMDFDDLHAKKYRVFKYSLDSGTFKKSSCNEYSEHLNQLIEANTAKGYGIYSISKLPIEEGYSLKEGYTRVIDGKTYLYSSMKLGKLFKDGEHVDLPIFVFSDEKGKFVPIEKR